MRGLQELCGPGPTSTKDCGAEVYEGEVVPVARKDLWWSLNLVEHLCRQPSLQAVKSSVILFSRCQPRVLLYFLLVGGHQAQELIWLQV